MTLITPTPSLATTPLSIVLNEAASASTVSHSITQTWTDQAIKCHLSGADCANCDIPRGNYSFVCQMNNVVPVLLETLGPPEASRVSKLFPVGLQGVHHPFTGQKS
jgi:hypothetical protein